MPRGVLGAREESTEGPGVRPCASGEVPLLADEARAARLRLKEAEADHILRLALLARAASSAGKDTAGALEAFAESAQVSRQTLQEFVTLTTRWEPAQVVSLLASEDRCGRALTRTLLLKVARGSCALRAAFDAAVAKRELDLAAHFPELLESRRASGKMRTTMATAEGGDDGKSQ
jgi:hypothetical protein